LVGLLDGLTAFCFGVPVGGLVITEINRRSGDSTERRLAVRAVVAQLDYLDRLVESLSPGDMQSASARLRDLAGAARSAMPGASAIAQGVSASVLFIGAGSLAVLPRMDETAAAQLRRVVTADRTWAQVGFSISRLAGELSRLMAALHPQESLPAGPGWLDDLIGALQVLLGLQLPAQHQWLSQAVQDPPAPLTIAAWKWSTLQPENKPMFVVSVQQADQPASAEERQRLASAALERAAGDLKDELADMARRLDALARLVDAAEACRTALS
jgi:hypothetical protein